MTQLNYRLLEADIFHYYPAPKFWIRWKRGPRPWLRKWSNIRGIQVRLWKLGCSFHYGPGVYYNGRKWVAYYYNDYQEWLENGGL